MPSRLERLRNRPGFQHCADVASYGGRTIAGEHVVCGCLQGLAAPSDRNAHLARVEQLVVILSVADPHGVVRRQTEDRERLAKTRSPC